MSDDDYGFEYSDDDQEEEDVNIENQYYNSKGLIDEDVDQALQGFRDVVKMEEEKGEWGFKVRSRDGESGSACVRMAPSSRGVCTRACGGGSRSRCAGTAHFEGVGRSSRSP